MTKSRYYWLQIVVIFGAWAFINGLAVLSLGFQSFYKQRPTGINNGYRNWYQYWGHCCLINDLGSSPQPEGEDRNWGINFYSIMMKPNWWWINKHCQSKCSNLSQNCPWLQHGYMCTSWGHVTWLFLLGNTCSDHCDVTIRFVTLNSNCTLHQNRQQNIHYHSWETDQN